MDPLITGLSAGVATLADRALERRARRRQRDRLIDVIAELPPGTHLGEWHGNSGWWITVPQRTLEP